MKTIRILFIVALVLTVGALSFNMIMIGLGALLARGQAQTIVENYPRTLKEELKARHTYFVPSSDIPLCAQEGIVSVEDKRFFQNEGIDPTAIARVILMSGVNDHVDHGGSTITQQLVRIIIQEPRKEPNFFAAVRDMLRIFRYALIINHDFSKEEILALYLNSVYYGKNAYGIAQAAKAYFRTSLSHLTLGQCLYLTGLPQAPSIFGKNPQGTFAIERYRHVIVTMVRNHYLTPAQATLLLAEKLF